MLSRLYHYALYLKAMQRVNMALGRAAAVSPKRRIDPTNPTSWEFSGFSQNGEDGIIDYLTTNIRDPNRYFIEIGAADGIENNSAWLAIAKKFRGLMIDGNPKSVQRCNQLMPSLNLYVECLHLFIDKNNIEELIKFALCKDPDLFSLDIDGNDYYIAQSIINAGFRPKIWVVEYNSAFGPVQSLTIAYRKNFNCRKAHKSQLYYGVSIAGWKTFFLQHGYQFVTVERNGVNAFFIKPDHFDNMFCKNIKGLEFQENFYQEKISRLAWEGQFEIIKHMPFVKI